MKKRFALIVAVIIFIAAIAALRSVKSDIVTEPAELTTLENSVHTNGFIVRDETMYYATGTGTPYFGASEGERISKDSQVAVIFEGKVDSDSIKELSVIDAKLKRAYEAEQNGLTHRSDTGSIENDIMMRVNEIYGFAEDDNVRMAAQQHEAIDSLRTNGEYNNDTGATRLEDEKWRTIQSIGSGRKEIYSEISGVFSTYLDGLEPVLVPDRIEQYTPSYIRGLPDAENEEADLNHVETGDPICKVMNNHVWYALAALNSDEAEKCSKNTSVKLRFNNMADAEVEGIIDYISDADENGDRLVLIRCSTYVESVFSYRRADMDIIFDSYTGYKVPVNAIRAGDGNPYVYGQAGSSSFKCEVKVLYTDSGSEYSIIESTEEAKNKLSRAERIIISDIE
ncbi:MAG: HlyD family efflux transporter periplasmic adaptor subunit [bacterium]|nr:HlyD family efflux transporter periplasmic adaptor subunit [bacterium]